MSKSKKHSRHTVLYDTDVAAKKIWLGLLSDFRRTDGLNFATGAEAAFMTGITDYRDYEYPELGLIPAARFKHWYQLKSLYKKYRFRNDSFDDEALVSKTLTGFFGKQQELATYKSRGLLEHRVLQCARKHAKRILGKYQPDATIDAAKFGKKSSIGCPLSLAYIDEKLSNVRAFTGSQECSKWFFEELLSGDPILTALVESMGVTLCDPKLRHESLNLVNVPKAWNKHRPITPYTVSISIQLRSR